MSATLQLNESPSQAQSISPRGWFTARSLLPPMSPKAIATKILDQLDLPETLRGRTVTLVGFLSEDDCRRFYPDRSLLLHEQACAFVRAEVRRRGGETRRSIIEFRHADQRSPLSRPADLADSHNQLIPMLVLP